MPRPTKDPSTKSYTITVDGIYREWMDSQENKSISIKNLIKLALELVGDGDFTEALIKKAASHLCIFRESLTSNIQLQ